jgi:arsenite/tail-anchored protein-transporting ATPase
MLLSLAERVPVLCFGGKGGVGKTTVAAATALALSERGRRVLLVSTDPAHNLGHVWERRIGPDPVTVLPGLQAMELDPQGVVEQHLAETTRLLQRLMPVHLSGQVARHMALARDAPGMAEAALLERIAGLVAGRPAGEHLIFDTAPTGHTLQLLAMPELMAAWIDGLIRQRDRAEGLGKRLQRLVSDRSAGASVFGDVPGPGSDRNTEIRVVLDRRRSLLAGLRRALTDAATTAFVIVLTAERLPVKETIELHGRLRDLNVPAGGLVINKRIPAGLGAFMDNRRRLETECLAELSAELPNIPVVELPLAETDIVGCDALATVAAELASRDG